LDYGDIHGVNDAWDGFPFYVMELVHGKSISSEMTSSVPPSVALRFRWIKHLGQALTYLHNKGILHRDVKPHNVMILDRDETVVLGDLGVVDWGDFCADYTDGIETYPSEVLSTWSYLPPEIEWGRSYDIKSESWAYGKTILEIARWTVLPRSTLLTGRAGLGPYAGGLFGIEAVISRLLEHDPAARLSVADALVDFDVYFETEALVYSIGPENYETIKRELLREPVELDNGVSNVDLIRKVESIQREPERFFSVGYRRDCPNCGSPLTTLLAMYKEAPESDYYAPDSLHACFGYAGKPCGLYNRDYYER
jgi:serine/threonine protein kinase